MCLLKKVSGVDHYKKVEETPSGNNYEACWRRSWNAGNKDFSWDTWKWVRNCHHPKGDAAFWIEWVETLADALHGGRSGSRILRTLPVDK